MTNFSTWLIAMFAIMFWLFRAIVALCEQFSIDLLGIVPYDFNMEIIICFAIIVCIVLIIKRKMIGSLIYLLIYGTYFGGHLLTNILLVLEDSSLLTIDLSMNLICDILGIFLALFAVLDMFVDKSRKINPVDKKTDWYFKNKKYDEELKARDNREDKNEYKFY